MTRLRTPAGRPASTRHSTRRSAVSGVAEAGLKTTALPYDERRRDLPGGDGDREVPRRDRRHHAERLAPAVQHRVRRVGRQARRRPAASPRRRSSAGCRAPARPRRSPRRSVLPSSRVSVRATSSSRSVSSSAALKRMAPRAGAGVAAQAGNASAAAATACAASAAVALGKTASTSSARAGFLVSKLAWSLAPTHSPPIRFLQVSIVHPAVAMPSAHLAATILRTAAPRPLVPARRSRPPGGLSRGPAAARACGRRGAASRGTRPRARPRWPRPTGGPRARPRARPSRSRAGCRARARRAGWPATGT